MDSAPLRAAPGSCLAMVASRVAAAWPAPGEPRPTDTQIALPVLQGLLSGREITCFRGDRQGASDAHPVPLLFVHGPGTRPGAGTTLPELLRGQGRYRAVALNLWGHGNRSLPTNRYRPVRLPISSRTSPRSPTACPAAGDHRSFGWADCSSSVIQTDAHHCPAGVLMSSMPPQGNLRGPRCAGCAAPGAIRQESRSSAGRCRTSALAAAREVLFSVGTRGRCGEVRRAAREGSARLRAVVLLSLRGPSVSLHRCWSSVPGDGAQYPPRSWRRARLPHRGRVLSADGPDMMLEPGWEMVAERIHTLAGWPRALTPGAADQCRNRAAIGRCWPDRRVPLPAPV